MEDVNIGVYSISMSLRNRNTNFRWVMTTVYGPVDHSMTDNFLYELQEVVINAGLPVVLGRDFNRD